MMRVREGGGGGGMPMPRGRVAALFTSVSGMSGSGMRVYAVRSTFPRDSPCLRDEGGMALGC